MPDLSQFTEENFQREVLDCATPVLVDFTAAWCGPCHMLAPVVAQLNEEWNGAVKLGHLDTDEHAALVMQYGSWACPP